MSLRIANLAPELANTFGDAENARVLAQRAQWSGLEVEQFNVTAGESLPEASLYVIGSSTDPQLGEQSAALQAWSAPLRQVLAAGATVLALGSGWELLGERVCTVSGAEFAGAALLAQYSEPAKRVADDLVVASDFGLLVGFENRDRRVTTAGLAPLGTRRAVHEAGTPEGIVSDGIFGTWMQGPMTAKNPSFADALLARAADFAGLHFSAGERCRAVDVQALAARESVLGRLELAL